MHGILDSSGLLEYMYGHLSLPVSLPLSRILTISERIAVTRKPCPQHAEPCFVNTEGMSVEM